MNIIASTNAYETWLGKQTRIDEADLNKKHSDMSQSAFVFLRATYYRWAQLWPKRCKTLAEAPAVLAVGDLHVENFGTWRDAEGRLAWGINDFDETCHMSYANDLVRLAVSASLAIKASHLSLSLPEACKATVRGYSDGLRNGGKAFVLSEEHGWLRAPAVGSLRDPVVFWKNMDAIPSIEGAIPEGAVEALRHIMPNDGLEFRVIHRTAGEGSLGRMRFVGIANWHGAQIAREAKALIPSAYLWANESEGPFEVYYTTVLSRAVRCPDPFLGTRSQWVVRRLAPDCSRIEVAQLAPIKDEIRLMNAMGFEAANIHLGSVGAVKAVVKHLSKLPKNWLIEAVETMEDAVVSDWNAWKKGNSKGG